MKTKIVFIISLFLLPMLVVQCTSGQQESLGKIVIGASIPPLADFARKIGGSKVEVFTIVPPGTNPHTFELTPGMMKKIDRADLLVFNGVGLEYWLNNVRDNLNEAKILFAARGLPILAGDKEHHAEGNPHLWLNPRNAIFMVKQIYSALANVDTANKAYYENNAAIFIKELEILDSDIEATVASWKQKKFICFHPAWIYFATRFGLEQAAVIEERHGMQPSPKDIAGIIQKAEEIGARVIFAEAQFPSQIADVIARESGIAVIQLDPLGAQGKMSYVELMRYNVTQMSRGMK